MGSLGVCLSLQRASFLCFSVLYLVTLLGVPVAWKTGLVGPDSDAETPVALRPRCSYFILLHRWEDGSAGK